MEKKLSIAGIAENLGISKTIISFILSGKAIEKNISKEKVKSVLEYVKEVGYKPNSMAQSLRTGKSYAIALLVEDISDPFFAGIAKFIEGKAIKNGYKIFYASTCNDVGKTRELIASMRDRHIDGYILSPFTGIEPEVNDLLYDNLPIVMFDRFLPGITADYVTVDNFQSAYNGTRYMLDQGYGELLFATFDSEYTNMLDRLSGYMKAIDEYGTKPSVLKFACSDNLEVITNNLCNYLSKQPNIDSIFFANSRIGMCGLKALKRMGKTIPDEIAVISFDDNDIYKLCWSTVTSLVQPVENIASNIISLLLKRMSKKNHLIETQSVVLSNEFVVGESTYKKLNWYPYRVY